jgi:hypothetical protein
MIEQGKAIPSTSVASTVYSEGMQLDNVTRISFQSILAGSPVGTIKLQVSNDLVNLPADVVNWQDYTGASSAISASGLHLFEVTSINVKWIRLAYIATSGTGTIESNFCSILDGREVR